MTLRLLVLAALLAVPACKGKPKHQDPPANAVTPPAPGSAGTDQHGDIHLPKGPGTPPKPTHGPLDEAAITRVMAMTFPRFSPDAKRNGSAVVVVQRTDDHPKLKATIQLHPCDGKCIPLELDKWKDRPDLKEFLYPDLKTAPDTTFEVGATELNGTPMIYTYQVGMLSTDHGKFYSDTYVLYYNDGHNEARVVAAYADDLPLSREAMLKMAPKEDLEHLAKAFLDVYTQAWAE